jgi:hypothetical protein
MDIAIGHGHHHRAWTSPSSMEIAIERDAEQKKNSLQIIFI